MPTPWVTKMSRAASDVAAASNSAHQACQGNTSAISIGSGGGSRHRSKPTIAAPSASLRSAALVPNV